MEGVITLVIVVFIAIVSLCAGSLAWNAATKDWQYKPCDSYQVWEYNQKLVPMRCEK